MITEEKSQLPSGGEVQYTGLGVALGQKQAPFFQGDRGRQRVWALIQEDEKLWGDR